MKKIFAMLLTIVVVLLCTACVPEVIKREPLEVRYTEPYEAMETNYVYKFNWWKGEFDLVPEVKTVKYAAKWEIKYWITYDDGYQKAEWVECSEKEYKRVKEKLGE